jgi:hypothetical protein
MNSHHLPFLVLSLVTVTLAVPSQIRADDTNSPSPPGVVDFASKLARNHWNLFGSETRESLDALNREFRKSQQGLREATTDEARHAAAARGAAAAAQLLATVKTCKRMIRLDLSGPRPVLVQLGSYEVPGDTGGLLFEVVTGTNEVSYGVTVFDYAQLPENSPLPNVAVSSNGTTYLLVGLEHVPAGRSEFLFELSRAGQPPVRHSLALVTPPAGRLKLKVLAEDTGKPVPAMVQLLWRVDGLVRQPGNGIEFAAQFEGLGSPTGARKANLPGPLNEPFWCMPGPVDMALAPGQWRIGVRRGVEYEPVFEDIFVRSGETVERELIPRRWVDMRKRGWWSGDDHVHCRIVSDEDARRLMAWVRAEDIHLANVVKMGDVYRTFFEQRGFGPQYRVADGDFVLVPGQECPRTHDQIGHTLAMNITSMVRDPDRYFLYDEVFDAVHAQGGLSGYAHGNTGLFHVHRDMSLNVPRQKVDFVEILQFNELGTELYYDFLNLGCKLTASAGSDVPWGGTIGEVRAYAFLGRKQFSADAWFDAFRRGRTFTTSGPMLEFSVDHALPGDELLLKSDRQLRIRARAWGDPKRMSPVKLDILRQGEVIRTIESSDPKQPAAQLDFIEPAGHGCWLAARVRAADGTSAHTTPVYVVREGFRFWKFDSLDALIAKRLASLAEVEQLVIEARGREKETRFRGLIYHKQLLNQGDALLQRVTQARGLYEALRETAKKERAAGRTFD